MDNREIAAVDEAAVKEAFETALRTYRPDFETFFLARLFGLEIAYGPESCVVDVPVRDFLYNPQGSVHGGVMAFALDVSMGHWIKHSTGRAGVTLEMKIQYLRPATAGRVRCEGRYLKRGRQVSYLESRATAGDGKLLAVSTATWQHLPA
ncbi:MAG TPA: PaaI family thioesterase [Microvirga sp.]|jgi:uncharacterized protein (TIGR00369 family)|nr:PaaI family thioesterase [Microvirga sp.]